MESKQNESSVLTNNPKKKLNQFILQIEHLKKIDDKKEIIINAIHNNKILSKSKSIKYSIKANTRKSRR